jgi:ABC-type branched-subunit amino acid transport system permease subunit
MVVLGGPGTRFGPVLGGIAFTFLDQRLTQWGATFDLPVLCRSRCSSWVASSSSRCTSSPAV